MSGVAPIEVTQKWVSGLLSFPVRYLPADHTSDGVACDQHIGWLWWCDASGLFAGDKGESCALTPAGVEAGVRAAVEEAPKGLPGMKRAETMLGEQVAQANRFSLEH